MMQQLNLEPFLPQPGVPVVPWDDWIHSFDYLLATDFAQVPSARRCAILINFLGNEGGRIVREFGYDDLVFDVVTPAEALSRQEDGIEISPSTSTITAGSSMQTAGLVGRSSVGERVLPPAQDGFQRICTALRKHFVYHKNVALERRQFRNRYQAQEEDIANSVAALRRLQATCEFGNIFDSILHDQFLEGTASRWLRARLYAEPQPLSFSRAVEVATVFEQTEKDLQELSGANSCQEVSSSPIVSRWRPVRASAIKQGDHFQDPSSCPSRGQHWVFQSNEQGEREVQRPSSELCRYCGRQPHPRNLYPAREKTCFLCGCRGHFSHVCRQREMRSSPNQNRHQKSYSVAQWKTNRLAKSCSSDRHGTAPVHDIQNEMPLEDDDSASVFAVRPAWWKGVTVDAQVLGHSLSFLLDTGSTVSILNEWTFEFFLQKKYRFEHHQNSFLITTVKQFL